MGLTLFTQDMVFSLALSSCVSALLLIVFIRVTLPSFSEHAQTHGRDGHWRQVRKLLFACAPIFAGGFLSYCLMNAPKYAIDSIMNDEAQAIYGFLSMPVFMIGLLSGFIFNPILLPMAVYWKEGNIKSFVLKIMRQSLYILLITVAVIVAGYFVGIPILSLMYDTDLRPYMFEFIVLLVAGGCLALSSLFYIILVIIRMQFSVLVGYAVVVGFAFVLSPMVVSANGIAGASVLYLILTAATSVILALFVVYGCKKRSIDKV
jgi:O-antigen/teichoic acid export membrane protein